MRSQPAVRFYEPPVTEYNSMDVDYSTESRISLDALDDVYLGPDDETESQISSDACDDVYLGPDDEIDYNSGSSGGLDVLDAIPDHLYPAQSEELPLFNDPDLYLGPDDDLIDCDEAPECFDVEIDAPAIPGIAIPAHATPPKCQSPIPELSNEDLHAMLREFMPLGSYDQTEFESILDRLGHYQQRHGNLPEPTVHQLLKANQPF
ncbi:hypothetical protein BDR07DRAFT_1480526 [Suillus spraguei]|nr:hypothetical protein BDR07DRAFT_1480526 [Suillus spraguei]